MTLRLLLLLLALFLFTPFSRHQLHAEDYVVKVGDGDGLAGWQYEGTSKWERKGGTLVFSKGKGKLSFDFPIKEGGLRFVVKHPPESQGFKGQIIASTIGPLGLGTITSSTTADNHPACENCKESVCYEMILETSKQANSDFSSERLDLRPAIFGINIEIESDHTVEISDIRIVEKNFTSLFNGTDLTGWEGGGQPAEVCWKVEDGLLVCTGLKKGPWLRSAKQYGDFNLRFDYWLSDGGNSGIFARVPEDGNHHRDNEQEPEAGFEIQLLDDNAEQYIGKLKDYQYTGSVYDIVGASEHVGKPAGQWNTIELNCKGQHITTIHNGKKIVDATAEVYPLLNLRKTEGYIGLQNHSSVVKFRNLRIGPALDY
ncbi:MAG: hypothetical protein CMJ46_06250 [Planctomyces sp.]|nr:hypothetical protein [Planctomyces sp.]